MPNHVTNRLVINADKLLVTKITDFLRGEPDEEGPCHIDFNKIIPMPPELMIEEGSRGNLGLAILKERECCGYTPPETQEQFDAMSPGDKNNCLMLGQRYRDNIEKYGHRTWYGWRIEHWGTKWNAYSHYKPKRNEIWFETAWSCVAPLIHTLSKMFPKAVFEYTYADEDTGSNCGMMHLQNGKGEVLEPTDGSKGAFEIAFEMQPGVRDLYTFDGTTYQYKEDE